MTTMVKRKMSLPLLAFAAAALLGSAPAAGESMPVRREGPMPIPAANAGMRASAHSPTPGWHGGGYKSRRQRTCRGLRVFVAKCRAAGLDEQTARTIYANRGAR